MNRSLARKVSLAALLLGWLPQVHGQGSLTPPGAPGPTMKSLDQVEPRRPVLPGTTITEPGSYYLTTNLTATLTITADNVTLDLMGFTILPAAAEAIDVPNEQRNIVVRNGTVQGGSTGLDARNVIGGLFEGILACSNASFGIYVGPGCTVRDCEARANGAAGIRVREGTNCIVRNCRIAGNAGIGLEVLGAGAMVEDNVVVGNGQNYSITQGHRLNLLIGELPARIDWPCSARVTGALRCSRTATNGIDVYADNVTLDLGGHTLTGPGASSGHGVYFDDLYTNIRVLNGTVANWRGDSQCGLYLGGGKADVEHIHAVSNTIGITASSGSVVSRCIASHNGDLGIIAGMGSSITECSAQLNGAGGILAGEGNTVSGCAANANRGPGIRSYGATLRGCAAYHNNADGIEAGPGSVVSQCMAQKNMSNGIVVLSGCLVTGNQSDQNGRDGDGAGFHVTGNGNRIEGNNATANDRGYDVDGQGNLIVRNSASGNAVNWDIVALNRVGTVVQAAVSGAVTGNTGGAGVNATNAWDNITY
ncbi:MAG: right-handed parallel beta-helix repeat-containing protein [Lentisphaerae bacterium]|nr:right-handed parallel beta-helix repeat-containing protein [Lentisphaerota bacterium]